MGFFLSRFLHEVVFPMGSHYMRVPLYNRKPVKIAVLIPDRNDRPLFLKNCLRMLEAQTLKPDHIELVNDVPLNDNCDITYRYRIGYERLRNKRFDIIAFIENDDWYSPAYLETMVNKWIELGKPDLLGTNYTIYYHLKLESYFTMKHDSRASAMNTLIKPDLNFPWCVDHEPYTDLHLWVRSGLNGIVFKPEQHISIGIKHGVGLTGGFCHTGKLDRYKENGVELIKQTMDKESFDFYFNYFNNEV